METKTCRFETILYLSTGSTSCQRFLKYLFVADKFIFKIINSGRVIPTLTTSPPFPWFISWKWKQIRVNSGLFRIQPRAPPPVGGFSKLIFVAENCRPSFPLSCSYWRPLQKLSTIAFCWYFVGSFFCVRVPDIIGKLKKCQSEQYVDQVLYSAMDSRKFYNKHHGDTVPKNRAACFYVLFISM